MGKVHTKNCVALLKNRKVNSHIRLCTRVWLHVYMFRTENFLRTVACKIFDDIHIFTAAIITSAWVAFCIFVC